MEVPKYVDFIFGQLVTKLVVAMVTRKCKMAAEMGKKSKFSVISFQIEGIE
jgi:hypothetical protein